jgi:hypothetical protein
MTGGSYNYIFANLEDELIDRMYDPELDDMIKDLIKLLYDLEWWQSGDTNEEKYRKTVKEFKTKWFTKKGRKFNLKRIIKEKTEKLKQILSQILETNK